MFYTALQPKRDVDFTHFRVCVVEDGVMQSVYLNDYQRAQSALSLCDTPGKMTHRAGDIRSLAMIRKDASRDFAEWEMVEFTGGPGDPSIYRYTVNKRNGSVMPLWHKHAAYFMLCLSAVFAFLLIKTVKTVVRLIRRMGRE